MKIFLDDNIIVDFLDKPNYDQAIAAEVMRLIRIAKKPVFVSPTTFAITWYIFSKRNKTTKNVKAVLTGFFEYFSFTSEDAMVMKKVIASDFADLEDALQYYSAVHSGVQLIITKNKKDFIQTGSVKVIHPAEFIDLHYNN